MKKKKLYEVEMTVYVMAENELEAHEVATDFEVEIPFGDCEIYEAGAVNSLWMDVIPYGSDDDQTCREILANKPVEVDRGKVCDCPVTGFPVHHKSRIVARNSLNR